MRTEEQIAEKVKTHIQNRRDGFEATQDCVRNEICSARRREHLVLILRPLRAIAALVAICLGLYVIFAHKSNELPLCPHSAKIVPHEKSSPYIADKESDIFNIDQTDRVCYCAPRYSGSLR